jgi:arsenite-transporting ATPase
VSGRAARFHLYGGKGGVGKTTLAAAAALARAERGGRVLLVSTDPAHSLGDVLDRTLAGGRSTLGAGAGSLVVRELDARAAFGAWLGERRERLLDIAERGSLLDRRAWDGLLDLPLPGVDELVGLLELLRIGAAGGFDLVVVDTAPTAHTLRLLAMPAVLERVAALLDALSLKHHVLEARFGAGPRADAGDALVAELRESARAFVDLLQDRRRSRLSWVLLGEPLALEETRDALAALGARGGGAPPLIL